MKGYIQVYTGNGKGKTTAAFGLSLRAIGNGLKVYFAQFVKGMPYSEIEAATRFLPEITIEQFGLECFIINKPTQQDIDAARHGLDKVKEALLSGKYDLVVLDEANIAVFYNLFSAEELVETIRLKNESTEVVVTGRYAPQQLIEIADLVTEMKEVKHYYTSGVEARKGIEF